MKKLRLVVGLLVGLLLTTIIPASLLASPPAQGRSFSGKIAQTFNNCGLTQIIGVVLDENGNHLRGTSVRLWWDGGGPLNATAGNYVRDLTGASGWEFTVQNHAVANTWYVAVDDGGTNLLSDPVTIQTDDRCKSGNANVVKVELRRGAQAAPAPAPAAPAPAAPAPSAPPGNTEVAPPITANATCDTYSETGGYRVCDDQNANFRTAFLKYGLQNVGYPVSERFKRDGFITQAFQKAIFQWRPDEERVAFVNVFDELHNRGFDVKLFEIRQTPRQLPAGWDGNISFNQVVEKRQALLTRPALRDAYFGVSDPMTFFGLPTSLERDMGNHYAIRLQRAVLQEWKEDVPWAGAGEVTIANGGDIAKELGHLPAFALKPGESAKATPVPSAAAPQPTATPVPPPAASSAPPRNLDARLGALGVTIQDANVAPGQPYWRVIEVLWHNEEEAEGRHAILLDVLDENGGRIVGQPVKYSWSGGSAIQNVEDKPFPEYGSNFPMYAAGQSYNVSVEGLPSDVVHGLGLGTPEKRAWTIHTEFLIKFQKAIK